MQQGGFQRKSKAAMEIPTSSLADMAFLLLIFFMVSTTFPSERPRKLPFPEAEATERLDSPRKDILHLYLEKDGRVYINDANIPMEDVSAIVAPKYAENRALIVMVRADENVPYSYVDAVQKELQQAGAVRVTFYTNLERRITRERR
ncbi:MAG: biopolymer transporter ExbD [Gemmatimonadota bacterium]|jgi:biopolymer transport protein ExbD